MNNNVSKVRRGDFSKDFIFGTASSAYQVCFGRAMSTMTILINFRDTSLKRPMFMFDLYLVQNYSS